MSKVRLYIARHGKTMFNTIGRAQGWSDTPLTTFGELGIKELGLGLKASNISFKEAFLVIVDVLYKLWKLFSGKCNKKIFPIREINESASGALVVWMEDMMATFLMAFCLEFQTEI